MSSVRPKMYFDVAKRRITKKILTHHKENGYFHLRNFHDFHDMAWEITVLKFPDIVNMSLHEQISK